MYEKKGQSDFRGIVLTDRTDALVHSSTMNDAMWRFYAQFCLLS